MRTNRRQGNKRQGWQCKTRQSEGRGRSVLQTSIHPYQCIPPIQSNPIQPLRISYILKRGRAPTCLHTSSGSINSVIPNVVHLPETTFTSCLPYSASRRLDLRGRLEKDIATHQRLATHRSITSHLQRSRDDRVQVK